MVNLTAAAANGRWLKLSVNKYPASACPGNRLLLSTMDQISSSVCGPIFVDTLIRNQTTSPFTAIAVI
jgi:hypothetical protein